jgi:hypothetical protein
MVERVRRAAEPQKVKKRRVVSARHGGKAVKAKSATQVTSPVKRRGSAASQSDPNAASPYFQHLKAVVERAERGEAVDSTGMTSEEFLKAFLGR